MNNPFTTSLSNSFLPKPSVSSLWSVPALQVSIWYNTAGIKAMVKKTGNAGNWQQKLPSRNTLIHFYKSRNIAIFFLQARRSSYFNLALRDCWIQRAKTRVSDPYSFDTEPGFWWPKIEKNLQPRTKKLHFFGIKTTSYLSLGLHNGRLSSRSLQLSKENI